MDIYEQTKTELRGLWQVASFCNALKGLHTVLKIPEFHVEEFETALAIRAKERHEQETIVKAAFNEKDSSYGGISLAPGLLQAIRSNCSSKDDLVENICSALVNGMKNLENDSVYTSHNWESSLKDICKSRYTKYFPDNPFPSDSLFVDLPIEAQVNIMLSLVHWRCEEDEGLCEYIRETLPGSWRYGSVGNNYEGDQFWYFQDNRLYVDRMEKTSVTTTRHMGSSSGITKWEIVCETREEWDSFMQSLKEATFPEDVRLYRTLCKIEQDAEEAFQAKAKVDKKLQLLSTPSRKSTRLESKFLQELQKEQERIDNENRIAEEGKRTKKSRRESSLAKAMFQNEQISGDSANDVQDNDHHDIFGADQSKDHETEKRGRDYNMERERLAQERELTMIQRDHQRQMRELRYKKRTEVKVDAPEPQRSESPEPTPSPVLPNRTQRKSTEPRERTPKLKISTQIPFEPFNPLKSPSQLFQELFLAPLAAEHKPLKHLKFQSDSDAIVSYYLKQTCLEASSNAEDKHQKADDAESHHSQADEVVATKALGFAVVEEKKPRKVKRGRALCPFESLGGYPAHSHPQTPIARMRPPFQQCFPSIYTSLEPRRVRIERHFD